VSAGERPSPPGAQKVGAAFWLSALAGWIVIAVGLRGIFQKHLDTRPTQLARFVVGGALAHDLLVAPLVLGAGGLVAWAVRGRAQAPVQAALFVSAVVVVFAYPLVRAYGLASRNPTSLPHNYMANLLVVLAVVWAVTGPVVLIRRRKAARR
jgi:hypothetical protein